MIVTMNNTKIDTQIDDLSHRFNLLERDFYGSEEEAEEAEEGDTTKEE